MSYCTFNRFQGAWLGSILGEALANPQSCSEQIKIIRYKPQNWVLVRDKIAEIVIKTERLKLNNISEQLTRLFNEDQEVSPIALNSADLILSLLPLIIFYGDNPDVFIKIVTQCNLNLANATETQEDILIWSYLLALVLNHQLDFQNLNASMIIRHVLSGVEVQTTSLVKQLETVISAWEDGATWHQLTEELTQLGNPNQTAIALSFYCFATTPKNFMLSVKRATNLKKNITWSTTTLTSAISGAYNGIAGVPRCWSIIANQNQAYQQAKTTTQELFSTWLGIYSTDDQQFFSDQELHAVASTQIIQPRNSLKIISQ